MNPIFHDFQVKNGSKNNEKPSRKLEEKLAKMKGNIKEWKCRKHCKTQRKTHIFKNPKRRADQKNSKKTTKNRGEMRVEKRRGSRTNISLILG